MAAKVPLSQLLYQQQPRPPPQPRGVSQADAQLEQRLLRALVAACVVAAAEGGRDRERVVAAVRGADWDVLLQLVVHLLNSRLAHDGSAEDAAAVGRLYAAGAACLAGRSSPSRASRAS